MPEIKATRISKTKFESFDKLLRGRIYKTVDNNTVQDLANLPSQSGVVFWIWIKNKCIRDSVGFSNAVRERLTSRKLSDVDNNMERLLRDMDADIHLLKGKEKFSVGQRLDILREAQATVAGKLTKDDPYYAPLVNLNSMLTHDAASVTWEYAKTELNGHYATYFQNDVEKIVLSKSTTGKGDGGSGNKSLELNFTLNTSNPANGIKAMLKSLNSNPSISASQKNKIKALAVDVSKQKKDLSEVVCWNCGKVGHYISACRLPGGGAHGKGGRGKGKGKGKGKGRGKGKGKGNGYGAWNNWNKPKHNNDNSGNASADVNVIEHVFCVELAEYDSMDEMEIDLNDAHVLDDVDYASAHVNQSSMAVPSPSNVLEEPDGINDIPPFTLNPFQFVIAPFTLNPFEGYDSQNIFEFHEGDAAVNTSVNVLEFNEIVDVNSVESEKLIYIDSCCSGHCTGNDSGLMDKMGVDGSANFADGKAGLLITASGKKRYMFKDIGGKSVAITFTGVRVAPGLTKTLLSMSKMSQQGFKFHLNDPAKMCMQIPKTNTKIPLKWHNNLLCAQLHFA